METERLVNLETQNKHFLFTSWLYASFAWFIMIFYAFIQLYPYKITYDGSNLMLFNYQLQLVFVGMMTVGIASQYAIHITNKRIAQGYHYKKTILLKDLDKW